eukprot:CAMPEP_0116544046 /NCGR_PEP_ID=MMETSP0397-20121206/1901_1 /TAXON_ID=216820 /ORGANISM="Cyclophora tenuis, Strain ECT3854" /LENGTH=128 /DNA_ID=CAMNT_0004068217 /DNA_START=790 /DNA_END=1176 /DNA_ORIENTATION=-
MKGFNQSQLIDFYERAKIIAAFCMRGSERTPIEAVLRGVVLITNSCQSAEDERDFPVPKNNFVHPSMGNTIETITERVLNNFSSEQAKYGKMRALYLKVGSETLAADTRCFIEAVETSESNLEKVSQV